MGGAISKWTGCRAVRKANGRGIRRCYKQMKGSWAVLYANGKGQGQGYDAAVSAWNGNWAVKKSKWNN